MDASTVPSPLEEHEFGGFTYFLQTHAPICSAPVADYPTVVFLGGLLQDVRAWHRCAKFLNQYTTVIAIDAPGTGFSPALPPEYGFDFIADAVASVLDRKGLECVTVGGASYGGLIAYRFAQRHPERLHSLILGGTFTQLLDEWREQARGHLEKIYDRQLDGVADEFIGSLLNLEPGVYVERQKLVRRVLKSTIERLTDGQVLQYIANIERVLTSEAIDTLPPPPVRSLLFTGEHDPFTTPGQMRSLARGFEDAVFTTVLDADHVSILERFDAVAEMLRRFLADETLAGLNGCTRPEYYGRAYQRDRTIAAA